MSDNEPVEQELGVKPRLHRAVTEYLTVVHKGGGIYTVSSQSGREYTVDAREARCDCADAQYNLDDDELCKHDYRVEVVRGERAIPAPVNRGDVDPMLAAAVDTTPVAVATDGGVVAEALDDEGERPDDCQCWDVDADLPCWPCYRDGFSAPNPATVGDEGGDL
jgi:hypothetical protein